MSENPYESPMGRPAAGLTSRRIRLNAFDKFCAVIGFALALPLLLLGALGLFMGCTGYFTLPPIIGVLPAFAGWGIVRAVYVAWKMTNRGGVIEDRAANLID